MSIQAMTWVMDQSESGGSDRLVALILANYADDNGIAGVAKATIAGQARVSPQTVKRCLASLAALSEIEEVAQEDAPDWWKAIPTSKRPRLWRFVGVSKWTPTRGTTGVSEGVHSCDPQSLDPLNQELENSRANGESDRLSLVAEFDLLWEKYPRKIDKRAGLLRYIARRREGRTAAELLAAAVAYGRERADEDPKYTKHASTFFGPSGAWEEWVDRADEPDPNETRMERMEREQGITW